MPYALEAAQNPQRFAGLAAALADVYVLKVAEPDRVFAQPALVCTAVLDFLDFVAHRLTITAVLFATTEQVLTV
jgi:hypothetical protein